MREHEVSAPGKHYLDRSALGVCRDLVMQSANQKPGRPLVLNTAPLSMPLLSLYINNKAGGLIYHRVRAMPPSLPFLLTRMPIGPPHLCPCHTGLCVACSKD